MQRIILSFALITITLGALGFGATTAFFNDTETSVGNVFTAGALDLQIDNESYYNGFPNEDTSWEQKDLTIEKFFDFDDVKPGDYGEDTISLHVENNDAYLCAAVALTSNEENGQTEPEALEDPTLGFGELAGLVNFLFWADDGDNVLEDDEEVIGEGPIGALGVGATTTIPLADSEVNIWNEESEGGPVTGATTYYVGKAWCFGEMGTDPVEQDGGDQGRDPSADNNGNGTYGEPEDGGITCDGSILGNESQTDSLTANVAFTAVQARHNDRFMCEREEVKDAQIVVTKVVINDNGGNNTINDFQLYVDDGLLGIPVQSGVTTSVPAGSYVVTEAGIPGYVASFSGDCNGFGEISVATGETKYCTITNNDLAPNITLVKSVVGTQPLLTPALFQMRLDGINVPQLTSIQVTSNSPHSINEVQRSGYSFLSMVGTSTYGKSCPAVLGGTVTLDEGETIVCTITNQKI